MRRNPAAATAILAAIVTLLSAGCGGDGDSAATTPTAAPPSATAFAIGITEANPHLIAPGPQPPEFARYRDRLIALKPTYIRVLVDWAALQPRGERAPSFAKLADGCMRTGPPCAPYRGLVPAAGGDREAAGDACARPLRHSALGGTARGGL